VSPVEQRRSELPRGAGDAMARTPLRLGNEHVNAMAVSGTGHEETMKYEMSRLRSRGFLN
jgi:hypothetical protein